MKSIIALLLLLFSFSAYALDVERTVDPNDTSSYTMSCTLPDSRTDGSALDAADIQTVEFHRSTDGTTYVQVSSELACSYVDDISALPDGVYYYKASVTDTGNRNSTLSTDRLVLTLRRIADPNPPANITGQPYVAP